MKLLIEEEKFRARIMPLTGRFPSRQFKLVSHVGRARFFGERPTFVCLANVKLLPELHHRPK
jgi:hypothetical protein